MSVDDLIACPCCAEKIQAAAKKCRFCGELLDQGQTASGPRSDLSPSGPSSFEAAFRRLCGFIGGSEAELISGLGRPTQAETNKYGTAFLFFEQHKALFVVQENDVVAQVSAPITDSAGQPLRESHDAFQINGLKLGEPRERANQCFRGLDASSNAPVIESRIGRNGKNYDIRLCFDPENGGWEGLRAGLTLTGTLIVHRPNVLRTVFQKVVVHVSGKEVANLGLGEEVVLNLPAGVHDLEVKGNLTSDRTSFILAGGGAIRYSATFNMLGFLKLKVD